MKLKLISLALASSLALNACNSGSGSNSTQLAVAGATKQSVTSSATSGGVFRSLYSSVLEGFSSSFILSPAGIGSAFGSLLTNLIFGEQEDPTTKTLAEINGKLDDILTELSDQLALSQDDSNVINQFYKTYVGDKLSQSLSTFSNDTSVITSKYDLYIDQKVFDNENVPQSEGGDVVSHMYKIAESQCKDTGIMDVIDAQKQTSSKTLKSISSDNQVWSIFTEFRDSYGKESSTYVDGTTYKILEQSKNNYITALKDAKIATDINLLGYINKYNLANINYAVKLSKSLQDLYNMQFAQLAYKYACNANIKFNNINLADDASGLDGYKQAVEKLNEVYEPVAKNLSNNLVTFMSPLSNKDLTELINTDWFKSTTPFLSKQFESSGAEPGNCSLTNLQLNKLATNSTHSYGVIDVDAQCVTKKTTSGFESATISLEVPYASEDGYNVDRYGISNIGFDLATGRSTYILESTGITSEDINQIASATDWCYNNWLSVCKESMDFATDAAQTTTSVTTENFWNYVAMEPTSTDILLYHNTYTKGYDDQADWVRAPMPGKVSYNTSKNMFFRDETRTTTSDSNKWDHFYTDYGFAIYNGKTFLVKFTTEYLQSINTGQNHVKVGIGCLSSTHGCNRNDYAVNPIPYDPKKELPKTSLNWNDGTNVVSETNITGEEVVHLWTVSNTTIKLSGSVN